MSKIILSKKAKLSKRQYEILMLRAMKFKYSEIESKLSIKQSTIIRHLKDAMFRFNAMSQQELIELAKRQKWVECTPRDNGMEYKIKQYEEIHSMRIFKALIWRLTMNPHYLETMGIHSDWPKHTAPNNPLAIEHP